MEPFIRRSIRERCPNGISCGRRGPGNEDGGSSPRSPCTSLSSGARRTRYLISLGHGKIAFLASDPGLQNIKERIEGYRQAMRKEKLSKFEQVILAGDPQIGTAMRTHTIDSGHWLAQCEESSAKYVERARFPT